MIVCKFGGTSVADREAQRAAGRRSCAIACDEAPLVVVSRRSQGSSDALIRHPRRGAGAGRADVVGSRTSERSRSGTSRCWPRRRAIRGATRASRRGLRLRHASRCSRTFAAASPRRRRRPRGLAHASSAPASSFASRIVADALDAAGVDAAWIDARTVVRTAGADPDEDAPQPRRSARSAAAPSRRSLCPGARSITQGFIGGAHRRRRAAADRCSDAAAPTTPRRFWARRLTPFARGDLDRRGRRAHREPEDRPAARRVKVALVRGGERARLLRREGAPPEHAAAGRSTAAIPVWVGNARRPDGAGTTILAQGDRPGRRPLRGQGDRRQARDHRRCRWSRRGCSWRTGSSRRIFAVFDAHRTPVDLVATSEVSVSLTIDDDRRLSEIVAALSEFARVDGRARDGGRLPRRRRDARERARRGRGVSRRSGTFRCA